MSEQNCAKCTDRLTDRQTYLPPSNLRHGGLSSIGMRMQMMSAHTHTQTHIHIQTDTNVRLITAAGQQGRTNATQYERVPHLSKRRLITPTGRAAAYSAM